MSNDSIMPPRRLGLADLALPGALERAASATARLDQALAGHPLCPAFLYRTRLEAVRRQAAADGHAIDAWHLAATLEGLRLRLDHVTQVYDRNTILDAAREALGLYQWLTRPDEEQEREIAKAEQALSKSRSSSVLISTASRFWEWLDTGGARSPMRAALIRYWVKHKRFRIPVPVTGPKALSSEAPGQESQRICSFLHALADEAKDYHQILIDMEREWFSARQRVAGRRSNSRAPKAIDVMAAAPLVSATTLARVVGMSIQGATLMLDEFVADGIAVEVTHRSARRLFGLSGLAPMREETDAPGRSKPGPGRGRPRKVIEVDEEDPGPPAPLPPVTPIERKVFDYGELEAVLAQLDQVNRSTKQKLDAMVRAQAI